MKQKELRDVCMARFGNDRGIRLANLIQRVAKLDFCVATAWSDEELSISRSCDHVGKIFKITLDYTAILSPEGVRIDLNESKYKDIAQYLPKAKFIEGRIHCQSDVYG